MTIGFSTAVRNARNDAIQTALGNAGLLRFYDGSRPATGGTATTLLAQLTMASPGFGASSSGAITAGTITGDSSADATGTATWARLLTSGATFIADMSVGTSGADINMTSVSFVATEPINVTSMVWTDGNP